MYIYKLIDTSGVSREESLTHYTHTLNTGSEGITTTKYVSGSINNKYWQSIHVLFYSSGSPILTEYDTAGLDKYDGKSHSLTLNNQYLNKFHGYPSGSIISIPQKYYGDQIKPKSFQFTDNSYTSNEGVNPIIKDDGKGNLYSTNAQYSQSINHISHSDNYVGNIFYDFGLAVLTENNPWSGSVNYSDLATNYHINFDSTQKIYTNEYTVTVGPNEFNKSMNYTLRCFPSASGFTMPADSASFMSNQYLCSEFTSASFHPYVTTIALYNRNETDEPVMTAKLPKPIKISNKISTIFKIRLDL